jgi:hypothetical protein
VSPVPARIGVIVSGGNVDWRRFTDIVSG